MAFDFGKIGRDKEIITDSNSSWSAYLHELGLPNPDTLYEFFVKEESLLVKRSLSRKTNDPRLFLLVHCNGRHAYFLPDVPSALKESKYYTAEGAHEILGKEWDEITIGIHNKYFKESSPSDDAKIALKLLTENPYRKSDAMADERTLLTVRARITAIELKIIEDIICEVNRKELPVILQEQNCRTFGDLYNTLGVLNIAEIDNKMFEPQGKVTLDTLGAYGYGEHAVINLYIDRLRVHSQGSLQALKRLVRTTYIHELFHAYFNIFGNTALDKSNIKEIEEPLVEYAMLLTMKERYSRYYYNMAKKNVQQKKDSAYCYAIGSSSELTPEVLRAYKYQKFLLDEKSDEAKSYISDVNNKRGLDVCAEKLIKELILPKIS